MVVDAGSACPVPGTPAESSAVAAGEGGMAVVVVASESPGGPIWGAVHPAERSSSTARLARSMNLIRSILVVHGT